MTLPKAFLHRPLAHRGLHGPGRPENSRAAFAAAIAQGYGIELDLQLSQDGAAMVFHDYALDRLTATTGPVRQKTSGELAAIQLSGGDEGIPTLSEVLDLVDGKVPLLVELKDQDGALGNDIGVLEEATASALRGYPGDVGLMSFNPHSVAKLQDLCAGTPRGLVTCAFPAQDWPLVPAERRDTLAAIPDYDRVGACFISHQNTDLDSPAVAALKASGAAVLTWTIRSPKEEADARRVADNITFEGYTPLDPNGIRST